MMLVFTLLVFSKGMHLVDINQEFLKISWQEVCVQLEVCLDNVS